MGGVLCLSPCLRDPFALGVGGGSILGALDFWKLPSTKSIVAIPSVETYIPFLSQRVHLDCHYRIRAKSHTIYGFDPIPYWQSS